MIDPYLVWTGIELDSIRPDRCNLLGYFFPEIAKLSNGKTVLDIGCGSGHLGFKAHQHGAKKVIALDYNPILIDAIGKVKAKYALDWLDIKLCDAMELPAAVTEPDLVIIGDSLSRNLLQAMWHLKLMELAKSWPQVKIIPNKIRIMATIITSDDLNNQLNYGYQDMNDVIGDIVRVTLQNSPLTVKDPVKSCELIPEVELICYDYDEREITCRSIVVPESNQTRWLQLTMLLGNSNEIYKFDRQVNFIPLDTNITTIKAIVDKNKQINRLIMR